LICNIENLLLRGKLTSYHWLIYREDTQVNFIILMKQLLQISPIIIFHPIKIKHLK